MKDCSVVFDTNAYRYFVRGRSYREVVQKTETLVDCEYRRGIQAYAYPYVLFELFKHLADVGDPHYVECKHSVIATYLHTKFRNSDLVKILVDAEHQLAKSLWNYESKEHIKELEQLCGYCAQVYRNPSDKQLVSLRPFFTAAALAVDVVANRFIVDLHNAAPVLNLSVVRSDAFMVKLAKALVLKAAIVAGEEDCTREEIERRADVLRGKLGTYLIFYREVLEKIAKSRGRLNLAKPQRLNWIWDIQISFCASADLLQGKRIVLVTDDHEIRTSAIKAGLQNHILTYKDYIESVGFNT